MRAAVVATQGGPYEVQDIPTPTPGAGEVRLQVHACGYCHSDENIRTMMASAWPRVPGHEVAGTIEALGPGVPNDWKEGDRVGIGWHGGHCLSCDECRAGRFLRCPRRQGCGSSYDGGFAEYVVAPWTALARIPDAMSFEEAGPVMCGGITVWNAIRNSGASWGDTVAVQGLGGLGHFAVQYADKMGFRTVVVSRGAEKEPLARQLGADDYIDAAAVDPAAALQDLGGARAIIATAPSGAAMRPLFQGLGGDGRLMIVGVSGDEVGAPAWEYLGGEKGIQGSVIGTPHAIEGLLDFSARKGIKPMIETFPLEEIGAAQERLLAGKMRFRGVFTMA